MIKIGICDDEQYFIDDLRECLDKILFQYTDYIFTVFHSGEEVIEAIDNHTFNCNLLFMDIFMGNMNGIDVAKYVCEKEIDTDLIFITRSKEHVYECYRYKAFAYLLKSAEKSKLEVEVKRYLSERELNGKALNITIRGTVKRIPLDSILYIESETRKVHVHTKSETYDYYEKMSVLEEMLEEEGFIRCHQSYLVPKTKVSSYSGNKLQIEDKDIPVSRRYQEKIKQLFAPEEIQNEKQNRNCYLTSSLSSNSAETGAIVCIQGDYVGAIIRIKPEQTILVGRDGETVDMVVNLPMVSRKHCEIIYHADSKEYEVIDYSTNGTFINDEQRLAKNTKYMLKPETQIYFGDCDTIYKLG